MADNTVHYRFPQKVLFKHCDPAGIAFYPRIFEMINDTVEAMFSELLNWPFETFHKTAAVPTTAFNVRFKAPMMQGDRLELCVTLMRLGNSSLTLMTRGMRDSQICFEAEQVLVYVDNNGKPQSWPDPIREKIKGIMETA